MCGRIWFDVKYVVCSTHSSRDASPSTSRLDPSRAGTHPGMPTASNPTVRLLCAMCTVSLCVRQ